MNSRSPRLIALFLALAVAATAAEFRGKLDPQVQPGTRSLAPVAPASAEVIAALPAAPAASDKVWAFSRPFSIKGKTYLLAVVASASGTKTLWLDRNGDGKFGPDESFPLTAPEVDVETTLPWGNGIYRDFPLRLHYTSKPMLRRNAAGEVVQPEADANVAPTLVTALIFNFNIVFGGVVEIDGKPLRVMFSPKPADTAIDPANQRVSLDADFNGRFEAEKGEAVNGSGRNPVFRVGTRYLAVKEASVLTGELVLEERPASEYTRFEAAPGQLMPDFAFVDFAGKARKLSDFRGQLVLLDFWGTWCGPCIEEMKHMDPLYEKYAARGFEIIGMNMERTSGKLTPEGYAEVNQKAAAYIQKAGHKWIQATQQSIERFAQETINVNVYPTCILIGRDGKVLSREARGQTLANLLAKHLP
jgi:thiol-disulfide isomerase/thioredoxin